MLHDRDPDFEAEIRVLTEAEGGGRTPPLQGIRWDFRYAGDDPGDQVYMIHPWFLDVDGDPLQVGAPLSGTLKAGMFVVVRDMLPVHKSRLSIGTRFFCVEGRRACAPGTVTRLCWLD